MKKVGGIRKPTPGVLLASAALLGATLLPIAARADVPFYSGWPGQQRAAQYDGDDRQARGGVTWAGDVDDTTLVYIHRQDVQTRTVSGKSAANVTVQFSGRLPERPGEVFLRRAEGRGRVRVVQQPSPANDWTAAVRLHDPQPGRGHYAFELVWQGRDFQGDQDRDGR